MNFQISPAISNLYAIEIAFNLQQHYDKVKEKGLILSQASLPSLAHSKASA